MKLRSWHYTFALTFIGLALHAWLILRWPIIFGGDSILRLVNRDHILLSYQLPALQASLHYLGMISADPVLVRWLMAAIGSIANVGFFLLASHFVERGAAFPAALLFASNPFLLAISTVPYQEILMLAGLLFTFHFFLSGRFAAASLCFGLACFTRYEAWAACPVLILELARIRRWRAAEVCKALLLFGWAPLLWMIYRHGIAPSGTYVLDSSISARRLLRYVYLGWITVKNTPIPVLLLAASGGMALTRERAWKRPGMLPLILFLLLFLISILFSAHGEAPDPERFVTAREAILLIFAVLLLACFGIRPLTRPGLALCGIGFCLGIYGAGRFVSAATSAPNMQLSYKLAQYLDANVLGAGERVIILAPPIPRPLIQSYLDKVARGSGPAALADANRVLHSMNTSPPEYQRTLVHSRLGEHRLLSFGGIAASDLPQPEWPGPEIEWIAIWSNFAPANRLEARLHDIAVKNWRPVGMLQSGQLSVVIYHSAGENEAFRGR